MARDPRGSPLLLLRGTLPTPPPSQAQPPSSTNLRAEGAPGDPNTSHLHLVYPEYRMLPKGRANHGLPGRGLCESLAWPHGAIQVNHRVGAARLRAGQLTSPGGAFVTVTSQSRPSNQKLIRLFFSLRALSFHRGFGLDTLGFRKQ